MWFVWTANWMSDNANICAIPWYHALCYVFGAIRLNIATYMSQSPEDAFRHTYCIYVPRKPGICFHYYCAVYDECKYPDTFWLVDRTRLFIQYSISLPLLCKPIWRHWTYKMPVRCILSSVWVRLSIFSSLSITQYVGLYVFSLPICLVMIEMIYILCLIIIIKSEVWTHCLGLGPETMVSAVCLSIFL